MTVVRGMEDPATLEGHSQLRDPGGGKHSKWRSLLGPVSPGHGHMHDPPSLSCLPCPNRAGWGWGQGRPWRGLAKHQEADGEQWSHHHESQPRDAGPCPS